MKKCVWLEICMEVEVDEGIDDNDETIMDSIHDDLVEQGFIIDDMGIYDIQENKQ